MNITQETENYHKTLWEQNLKDKLKTTPDRGIKKFSKTFRIDWSKVFKRGWLLWK